jgi:hypothetical protein
MQKVGLDVAHRATHVLVLLADRGYVVQGISRGVGID